MATHRYLRRDVPSAYEKDGYAAQCLFNGESCLVIGSSVAPGGYAPPHHVHEFSDQLYFVSEGAMQIQLGEETLVAETETLVYIPQGTPHHNWNEGASHEFHFEVLAPVPFTTQPIATPTDSTDAEGRSYLVLAAADVPEIEAMPGFRHRKLLGQHDGSDHMTISLMEVDPGAGGPPTHIHEFDQFFYILAGEMTVEVALATFCARAGDLVVLPAGVPHTQYNAGEVAERHLALLSPSPSPDRPLDVGVSLAATGRSFG